MAKKDAKGSKKSAKSPSGDGVLSYRSRALRAVGHDLFFRCDHPLVGVEVPGRGGGQISGCATPSAKHPKELQLWVGLPGVGRPLRRSTVRDRLRGKTAFGEGETTLEDRKAATQEAVSRWRVDAFPAPVGRVYPGRPGSSRCDAEHPVWSGYSEALELADEEAGERFDVEGEIDPREYREAQRAALERQNRAQFALWDQVTRSCVETYEKTFARARGYESPQAATARARAAFIRAGGDPGSGEWDDALSDATKAAKKRARKSSGKRSGKAKRS